MPRVYRLETHDGKRGPFTGTLAAWDVNDVAEQHGRHLGEDMPGPNSDPAIKTAFNKSKYGSIRFGFARIKDYERWTKHPDVRKAFAEWKNPRDGDTLHFAVYEVPKIVAKSAHQAIFAAGTAKLIDSRSPATPRKRNSFKPLTFTPTPTPFLNYLKEIAA
jgi:hypothetical protein